MENKFKVGDKVIDIFAGKHIPCAVLGVLERADEGIMCEVTDGIDTWTIHTDWLIAERSKVTLLTEGDRVTVSMLDRQPMQEPWYFVTMSQSGKFICSKEDPRKAFEDRKMIEVSAWDVCEPVKEDFWLDWAEIQKIVAEKMGVSPDMIFINPPY